MSNSLESQGRTVALWNNRPVVVLLEDSKYHAYFHGLVIGPPGMTIAVALWTIDKVFHEALGDEDWNYTDVLDAMKAAGFEEIPAAEWRENRA